MYRKDPKYSDTLKNCCNYPKIWKVLLYHRVMSSKDAEGIANSLDPDQAALLDLPQWSLVFGQVGLGKQSRPRSDYS